MRGRKKGEREREGREGGERRKEGRRGGGKEKKKRAIAREKKSDIEKRPTNARVIVAKLAINAIEAVDAERRKELN